MINHPALSARNTRAKRELTERRPSDCASSIAVHFFSRIAPGMNNSEDLAPVYVQHLTPAISFLRPLGCAGCHIPQSLRVPAASAFVPCPVVRTATPRPRPLYGPFHPLRGSFCILKCTRETLSELWPFARSDIRRASLSWITWPHRFCLASGSLFDRFIRTRCRTRSIRNLKLIASIANLF